SRPFSYTRSAESGRCHSSGRASVATHLATHNYRRQNPGPSAPALRGYDRGSSGASQPTEAIATASSATDQHSAGNGDLPPRRLRSQSEWAAAHRTPTAAAPASVNLQPSNLTSA